MCDFHACASIERLSTHMIMKCFLLYLANITCVHRWVVFFVLKLQNLTAIELAELWNAQMFVMKPQKFNRATTVCHTILYVASSSGPASGRWL